MSNYLSYTPEQQAKIRRMETNFNMWESEWMHHQTIADKAQADANAARTQKRAAETKLVNFLLQCDAELENR